MFRDRLIPALRAAIAPPAPQPPPLSPVAEAASRLSEPYAREDAFYNSMTGLGGTSDKGVAARPTLRAPMVWTELEFLYHQSGLIHRVVSMLPKDATRRGVKLTGEPDPEILADLAHLERRLMLYPRVGEAWKWGRLYGHAGILMVVDEVGNPDLSEPMDPRKVIRLRNLVVLDGVELTPAAYDTDLASPTFRAPSSWYVSPRVAGGAAGLKSGSIVHGSRVIPFYGVKRAPSLVYDSRFGQFLGVSYVQVVIDALRDLISVSQAGAVIAQEMRMDVLKSVNLGARSTSGGAAAFESRMQQIATARAVLNMILLGEGEDYQTRAGTVAGFTDLYESCRKNVCAATGYPSTLLFGDAPAGFSTDGKSWQQIYAIQVLSEQIDHLYPGLSRIYEVLSWSKEGPWKGRPPETWDLEFLPIYEMTSKEVADLRLVNAQADAAYVDAGILDPAHVARSRFGGHEYGETILPVEEDDLPPPADAMAEAVAEAKAQALAQVAAKNATPPPAEPTEEEPAVKLDADGRLPDEAIDRLTEMYPLPGVTREEFAAGVMHETEHTPNLIDAAGLAATHLRKIPDYYTRLERMECEAGETA